MADDVQIEGNVPAPEESEPKAPTPKKAAPAKAGAKKAAAKKEYKYAWQRKYPDAKPVTVEFEETDEIPPTGQFVAINGDSYVIKPGEEVTVPDFLLKHVDNCVSGKPVVNPQTRKVVNYRNRSRFPYRIIRHGE